MSEFRDFIEKRFGCDCNAVDTTSAGAETVSTNVKASEATQISATAANMRFMTRFCEVN